MTAEEYAKEFVNDFLNDLPKLDLNVEEFGFNSAVFEDDPNLVILNKELNKVGYTIYLSSPKENLYKIKKI